MVGTDVVVRAVDYASMTTDGRRPSRRTGCSPTSPTPDAAPAAELVALYPQRWEFETALDELKTHQRGLRVVLRSKMPDCVRQEINGYLCVYYAIRWLMHAVALEADADPDRGNSRSATAELALPLGLRDVGYARVSSSTGMVRTPAVWRAYSAKPG